MQHGRTRGSRKSTRGDVSVQSLILIGCVALAGIAAFVLFGSSVQKKVLEQGQLVADLTATRGGTGGPGGSCPNGMCLPGSGNCFVAGTPVLTRRGAVPIEQIRSGDEVLSRDPDDGELVVATVGTTYVRLAPSLARVRIADPYGSDETIYATPEHRFWTVTRGWQAAGELTASDRVLDDRGDELKVVGSEPIAATAVVFNFEVERTHTYFVGSTPILVHNPDYAPTASSGSSDPGAGSSTGSDNAPSPFGLSPWGNGPSSSTSSAEDRRQWVSSLQKFSGNTENGQKVTFVKAPYPISSDAAGYIKHSKEGVSPEHMIVVGKNDAMPKNGTQRDAEIDAARRIVQDYLTRIGEAGTIGDVKFQRPERFKPGVEGETDPGTHLVRINGTFHTTGTIVHEMLHSVSHPAHDSVYNVSNPVNEGLTE